MENVYILGTKKSPLIRAFSMHSFEALMALICLTRQIVINEYRYISFIDI